MTVGALPTAEAVRYLGLKDRKSIGKLPIPRVDVSTPGAKRATWSYRVADLDAFLASRLVKPGH